MTYLIGSIIGLILGLTGAGGSVFAVPLLVFVLDLPVQEAIAISLGAVAISAFLGFLLKLKSNDVVWLPGIVFAVVGSAFAPVGNLANRYVPPEAILISFSLLVIVVAFRMWISARENPDQASAVRAHTSKEEAPPVALCRYNQNKQFQLRLPCIASISVGAVITGFLSGFFGVGGGFIIVPTLLFLTAMPIKQAVATSLFVIALVSTSGFISFINTSSDWNPTILMQVAAGGLVGMLFGVAISRYMAGPTLQKTFAVSMLGVAVITLAKSV